MSMTTKIDCLIVGGGAAGMMCAGRAVESGRSVAIIEKNDVYGKKLYITGKGRCNLTNNCDRNTFFENVVSNPKFLYGAYGTFNCINTMELFERLGVPLKTERGNRVFPVSDKAADIVKSLERYSENAIRIHGKASGLITDGDKVTGAVLSDGRKIFASKTVLATGGASYPGTGSDGSGYRIAEAAGHHIVPIRASLVPIEVHESDTCKALQGLTLKNAEIKLIRGDRTVYSDFGELLFTHFGVSGPIILSASSVAESGDIIQIDMKPALDEQKLDSRVLADFNKYSNKDLINALADLLPSKMIPVIVSLSGIDPHKKINSVNKTERLRLVGLLKRFELTVLSLRPVAEAVITRGGIDVRQVNPKTMESKIVRNLYFCGEILDVDAYTGGFNLQIAFSTAVRAAENI